MPELIEATVTSGEIPRFEALAEPAQVAEPITLAEAKAHLRVVYDDEDDYIASLIVAAREMAEGKLNRTITQRVREQAFPAWGAMPLLKPPFIQIESVSYFDSDGTEQFIETSELMVTTRSEPARVALPLAMRAWPPALDHRQEAVIVRYLAGYNPGEVPNMIIAWMKLVIGALYAQRESMVVGVSVAMIPDEFNKWLLQPHMVYE